MLLVTVKKRIADSREACQCERVRAFYHKAMVQGPQALRPRYCKIGVLPESLGFPKQITMNIINLDAQGDVVDPMVCEPPRSGTVND
jgi:hypothetical protein